MKSDLPIKNSGMWALRNYNESLLSDLPDEIVRDAYYAQLELLMSDDDNAIDF